MEFVEGETLENLIRRSGRLEVKLALEIAAQVAAGLAAVHKKGLVHRDIKPSNIMVNFEDEGAVTAKIIDLGLAKAVNEAGSQTAISIPGGFAGTPEFASPEQFAGVGVDIRSDLYSLGVALWEMVTGHVLFRGSPAEVMYQHQHAPLPLEQLESVPQPVVSLIEVLLDKDPKRRFQTPAELLKALPTITGAIDEGRTITYQSLGQMPDGDSYSRNSQAASKTGTGEDFNSQIARYRERYFWAGGGYRFPGWLLGKRGYKCRHDRGLGRCREVDARQPLAQSGWPPNTIVLLSWFLVGPFTGRALPGAPPPQMNFLTLLSLGLEIQIHGSERHGRRAKDWRNSSRIVEPYWFWMAWSRSKIRLVHKKDGCAILPSRRFCASLLPSIRGFA